LYVTLFFSFLFVILTFLFCLDREKRREKSRNMVFPLAVFCIVVVVLICQQQVVSTDVPTVDPTHAPSMIPTFSPTRTPTRNPTTFSPTFPPTISATASPTVIPITFSKSSLVMGIGAGTLTIIVLAVALAVVFCLSEGCERNDKTGSRVISSAIFGIIFLALIFAPRENQTIDTTTTVTDSNSNLYDPHIVPRVVISIIVIAFSAIASCVFCLDLRDHHNVSLFRLGCLFTASLMILFYRDSCPI
jgi:hypothetical protein